MNRPKSQSFACFVAFSNWFSVVLVGSSVYLEIVFDKWSTFWLNGHVAFERSIYRFVENRKYAASYLGSWQDAALLYNSNKRSLVRYMRCNLIYCICRYLAAHFIFPCSCRISAWIFLEWLLNTDCSKHKQKMSEMTRSQTISMQFWENWFTIRHLSRESNSKFSLFGSKIAFIHDRM